MTQSEIKQYKVINADRQINHTRHKVGAVIDLPVNVACYYANELELVGAGSACPTGRANLAPTSEPATVAELEAIVAKLELDLKASKDAKEPKAKQTAITKELNKAKGALLSHPDYVEEEADGK